jgi:streptogramin lyase
VARAQPVLWGTASANASFPNGRLLRIDYFAGTVQATFNGPTGALIGDGFTGVAIRPSNGQLFVTDGLGTNAVFRIDPNTGSVLSSFTAPTNNNSVDGLEFFGNELYANQFASSVITRINPDTGAFIGNLPMSVGSNFQGGLTTALGVLLSHGIGGNNRIARRDAITGAILSEFATPNNEAVLGLASDGTSVYAAAATGFIYRLNPISGSVLDSRNIGIPLDGLGGLISIPEPSSAWLVLTCVLAVFARRRRLSLQEMASTHI